MALDASVFNALAMPRKSAIDYRDQYGAADQQYASNALAIQKAQADAADAALARGDQMAYRNALAALPADATPDQAISAAQNTRTPLGMTQAQTMRKAQLDATKTQADIGHLGAQTRAQDSTATLNAAKTDKEKHDLQQSKLTQHLQGLFAVNDPQAAAAWLDKASQLDDADYSPEQVAGVKQMLAQNPAAFSQWKLGAMNRGMTIVQQREQAMKDAELARQKQADLVKAANENIIIDPATGQPSINAPLVQAKKDIAAKGANNVNVKVDTKLGDSVAQQVGPMMKESYETATGARQQIGTADQLIKAIDSGKVIAGPGADVRLKLAQIGSSLGITGKDTEEQIANTRAAIQGLAQSTVAARASLKGQGQVSDYEGRLLQKAASGEVSDLTPQEIRQIALVNKRLAAQQVTLHNARVSKLKGNPTTAPLADFYEAIPLTGDPQAAPASPSAPSALPSMSDIEAAIARKQGKK
jgi:hypothetical protein